MKYVIALILLALLAGCDASKDEAAMALRDTMHPCPKGSVTYQTSSSSDGVAWFSARCEVKP